MQQAVAAFLSENPSETLLFLAEVFAALSR